MSRRHVLIAAALAALTLPLVAGCVSNDTAGSTASASAGTLTVKSTADACDVSAATAPSGHRAVLRHQRGQRRHGVLPAEPTTACGSSPRWRTSGPASPATSSCRSSRASTSRRASRAWSATASAARSRSPTPGPRSARPATPPTSSRPPRPSTSRTSRTRWARSSPAPRRSPTPTPRVTTPRPSSCTPTRAATTSASSPSPSRSATWTRSSTPARPTSRPADTWTGWHMIEKDLWQPTAEANGGVAYVPLTADQRKAAAADLVSNTQALADEVNSPDLHARGVPDRERRQGPARRGRRQQGHRRGGDLVAHRPLGLPGQRRGRQGRLRGPRRRRRGAGPRPAPSSSTPGSPRRSRCWPRRARSTRGFTYYDKLTPEQVKAFAASVDALSEPLSQLTDHRDGQLARPRSQGVTCPPPRTRPTPPRSSPPTSPNAPASRGEGSSG